MRNIGKWTSSNKAIDITGQLHGPWEPLELAGSYLGTTHWKVKCSVCGFEPKPMNKQSLNRAKKNQQERCSFCPKEPK
jgi:hypothetical protein